MKKTISILFITAMLLLGSGCSSFLKQSDSVWFMPYDEIDSSIRKYETSGITPDGHEIGELYAFRSVCHAQHDPAFLRTRSGLNWFSEVFPWHSESGFALFLGCVGVPVGATVDIVMMPIKFVRTRTISDEDIQLALKDLEQARVLGYHYSGWYPPEIATPPRKHIDHLGYELENYIRIDQNQGMEPTSANAQSIVPEG